MGVLLDRVTALRDAYDWENNRIADWNGDMDVSPGEDVNDIAGRFERSWRKYFTELVDSNNAVIDICQAAIDADTEAKARKAIKKINEEFHRRTAIAALSADALDKKDYSEYFGAVSAALIIEVEARDYIATYLEDGEIT